MFLVLEKSVITLPRIIRVGQNKGEKQWSQVVENMRNDDFILLSPGYYEIPEGAKFANVTIKGTGGVPEDTTLSGHITLDEYTSFLNLDNLCIKTNTDHNALFIPPAADTYLSLRRCLVVATDSNVAAMAFNGKCTVELYSTTVRNGSVSFFETADFRLEMSNSTLDYDSKDYSALALEGHGTAVVNDSKVTGNISTFKKANVELDINNSDVGLLLLHGKTWLNLLESKISGKGRVVLYATDRCWLNIIDTIIYNGSYFDRNTKVFASNTDFYQLDMANSAKMYADNIVFNYQANLQDKAFIDAKMCKFMGTFYVDDYIALSDKAEIKGSAITIDPEGSHTIAVHDDAKLNIDVISSTENNISVSYDNKDNINITGNDWHLEK